jgi:magnesium chelatase subunit D
MTADARAMHAPWSDALLAACVLALDPPALGGIHVRARAGPVLDRWLEHFYALLPAGTPARRIAAGIAEARLTGGLDVALTLDRGSPSLETGVLAAAHGGIVVLAMAERLSAGCTGILAAALDDGIVRIERDGLSMRDATRVALVALDEGVDNEGIAPALMDRLALRIDLGSVGIRDAQSLPRPDLAAARRLLQCVILPDQLRAALVAASVAAGKVSMRPAMALCRVACRLAALRGDPDVAAEDAIAALRLVLGVHVAPPVENEAQPEPPSAQPEPSGAEGPLDESGLDQGALTEMLVQAAMASLPQGLLDRMTTGGRQRGRRGAAGKAGVPLRNATRGRAIGITDRPPAPGARLDVLATLRAAAPWQRIRGSSDAARDRAGHTPHGRLLVRKQDFRFVRYREKTGTVALFAVDASGSAAVERLAETKGAVELLLAQCYVRRDSVAMVAFRGSTAEVLLEPTRSLVRAKRQLSALPGGGGTPLAAGVMATLLLAETASRKGNEVLAIFLTDGRGNVALDGTSDRARVASDLDSTARRFRSAGFRSILIDTARRPQTRAEALANDLGSDYVALPYAGSAAIAGEIGGRLGR